MRKVLPLLFCFTYLLSNSLFSQNKLSTDSTYLAIEKIENDSVRQAKSLGYMVALLMKKDAKGPLYSDMLLKDAQAKGDQKYLAAVYANIGSGYLRIGEYSLSYASSLKALAILQKINEPFLLIRTYQNLVWIQIQLKDVNAENTIHDALKVAGEHNLKGSEAELYNMLGVVYDSHEQFDKAIASYKSSLTLGEKYATKYAQTSTNINLGISYRRFKRYTEAVESFLTAKKLADEVKDNYLFQTVYQNLAELTFATKDYDGAEKYVLLALANSKDNYEAVARRGLYENLKNIYEKKGDYQKALAYGDSVMVMDKRVFDKDKVASVRDLQTKYESAIKDKKIQQQNAENLQQQQLLVIGQKQAQIQKLNFENKQRQFETEKRLQASLLQKNLLQNRLDKQSSSAKIFRQNEIIKTSTRLQLFLLFVTAAVFVIGGLTFYNQHKTKRLNRVILAQKNDLENANTVKDRLFSIIGHDMRSPINTMIAFNSLLEQEELTADQMKLYANEIKKALNHTSSMINNLLSWASSQMQGYHPDLQTHRLREIAELVVVAVNAQAEQKNIVIANNIPANLFIFADNNMIELILRNLITNSIKFTPKNGFITLNADQSATETRFSVTDNGKGLSAELLSLINSQKTGSPIKSTRGTNKEKGTGLGLLLCKTFADLMNGSITASSTAGEGSTFHVSLPIS